MTSMTHVPRQRQTPELDLFRLYLDEAGRHPLLTKQEEIRLSQAYQAGLDAERKLAHGDPTDPARPQLQDLADRGQRAQRTMIQANLRLVVSITRRYTASGLPLGDLVQEGNLGLLQAVEKFDWRKGCKFSTYATWWIKQAIARGAADRGARTIRLPVHVDEQVGRLRRVRTRLHEQLGREPTDEELAVELRVSVDRVVRLHGATQVIISLETPIGDSGAALGTSSRTTPRPVPTSWRWRRSATRRLSGRWPRCPNANGRG
jgi:RNA polymerase primary sigma factor